MAPIPNKEAFAALLQTAREMKPETFHMRNYGHREYINLANGETWGSPFDFDADADPIENPHCGSPMCLLGHFAAREDLQSFLKYKAKTATIWYAEPQPDEDFNGDVVLMDKQATYNDELLCEWFGITQVQADALFGTSGCGSATTPAEAIDYIERFLALQENNERARARFGL